MFLRLAPATVALFATLLLVACGSDGRDGTPTGADGENPRVMTSLDIFADFVREVGGDRVEVTALLPSGADPHTYEPTPSDIRRITEAEIIFVNGLDLEAAALKVIEPNLPSGVPMIELAEEASEAGVALRPFGGGEEHEEDQHVHEGADPHVWLSVDNVREYARIIRDGLTDVDPEGAPQYEENYQSHLARLDGLDEYVREAVSTVPPERRKIVSTHAAFGYMADYMDFEVAGVVAISPGQDPSPRDIADLTNAIKDQGVPAVFTEPQIGADSRLLEQIAADAGVQVCTLYSDTLTDDVPTYIDMMRFNADELLRCLGGASD